MNPAGKTILITGAGSGIGAACARLFHARGANVVLVDIQADAIARLAGELGGPGLERVLACPCSVTDRAALDETVRKTLARFGALDMALANAGIASPQPATLRTMDEAVFERIIEVNLLGVWRTARACLPAIVASGGHIMVTASIYAYINGVINAPYAISKAGIEMFGRALRAELAGTGATAGVLYPAWVSTPLARHAMGGHRLASTLVRRAFPGPFSRPVTPERVAAAVLAGFARRAARVTVPRRWLPIALLRGLLNPLFDALLDRLPALHKEIRKLEQPSD